MKSQTTPTGLVLRNQPLLTWPTSTRGRLWSIRFLIAWEANNFLQNGYTVTLIGRKLCLFVKRTVAFDLKFQTMPTVTNTQKSTAFYLTYQHRRPSLEYSLLDCLKNNQFPTRQIYCVVNSSKTGPFRQKTCRVRLKFFVLPLKSQTTPTGVVLRNQPLLTWPTNTGGRL